MASHPRIETPIFALSAALTLSCRWRSEAHRTLFSKVTTQYHIVHPVSCARGRNSVAQLEIEISAQGSNKEARSTFVLSAHPCPLEASPGHAQVRLGAPARCQAARACLHV